MSEAASQWVSVAEAAGAVGVSERTVWRWVRDSIVESRQEKKGQQSTRLINRESLPDGESQELSEAVGVCPDMSEGGSASRGLSPPRQESAPLECACCKVRESEVEHLRAQLDVRVEEMEKERTAGEQLRVMLMKLEATNAELAGALVQKALPPAPEEKPRVRWWNLLWR